MQRRKKLSPGTLAAYVEKEGRKNNRFTLAHEVAGLAR